MLKIDTHNHIIPKKLPVFKDRFGYGGFIFLEQAEGDYLNMVRDDGVFFRKIERNCWDIEKRLEEMDEFNVDVQVLSAIPVMFCYWAKAKDAAQVHRFMNEDMLTQIQRRPKRFIGLGTVPMQDPEIAIQEMHYCVKELGLPGIQIGSHFGDINLDDQQFYDFYSEAQKLNCSLLVHPWDMMGKETMEKYWLPWLVGMPAETTRAICSMIFGGIFDKFPKLKVLFAHGGGSFPGTLGRIEHGFHCRPDLCAINIDKSPRDYVDKFYVDSITHDETALKALVSLFGFERVALGTDYPFPLGELTPGRLIEGVEDFTQIQKEQLLGQTALDWLGLDAAQFNNG